MVVTNNLWVVPPSCKLLKTDSDFLIWKEIWLEKPYEIFDRNIIIAL